MIAIKSEYECKMMNTKVIIANKDILITFYKSFGIISLVVFNITICVIGVVWIYIKELENGYLYP